MAETHSKNDATAVRKIQCGAVWAGIHNHDDEIGIGAVRASIFSRAYGEGREGGDIYSFSICNADDLTRVVIADVRGHGEAVTGISRSVLESLQRHMNQLDGNLVLEDLNRAAQQHGVTGMTTAAIVSYYRPHRSLYFSYAGHPAALVQRAGTTDWVPAELVADGDPPRNLPLAVMDEVPYDQTRLPLEVGDRLLVYTDGVTETPDASGEQLEQAGLLEILRRGQGMSVGELKTTIVEGLHAYRGGPLDHDDVTLLVLEITEGDPA